MPARETGHYRQKIAGRQPLRGRGLRIPIMLPGESAQGRLHHLASHPDLAHHRPGAGNHGGDLFRRQRLDRCVQRGVSPAQSAAPHVCRGRVFAGFRAPVVADAADPDGRADARADRSGVHRAVVDTRGDQPCRRATRASAGVAHSVRPASRSV